jgi:hypothetical protein
MGTGFVAIRTRLFKAGALGCDRARHVFFMRLAITTLMLISSMRLNAVI